MRILLIPTLMTAAAMAAGGGLTSLPVFFIPNVGGAPYMAKGSGLTASFAPEGVLFHMGRISVHMTFEGASPQARLDGGERLPGRVNFLHGDPADWRTGMPMYSSVVYHELYPGIDMSYGSNGRNLKSEYVVAPGADPACIRVRYSGVRGVRVDGDGALVLSDGDQELREQAPVAYQERNGKRIPISVQYSPAPDGTVGFIVRDYDAGLPLVIDPVLVYSTLLGGSSADSALSMAVDATGAVYLAGFTSSYDFPTASPEQALSGGGNDAFVAKLNAAGTALVYCTYLGGAGDDRAYGIAVDGSGSAYITGSTASKNFPVRNALQSKLTGTRNAFVAKLSASGNALIFSTYLGGTGSDVGNGIALDTGGNVYVVGDTTSSGFPTTTTAFQKAYHGSQDAFVASLSTDGSSLRYGTFLGGASSEHGAAIAVDGTGSAYVTGSTFSTDFPTANAYQPSNAGGQDAFAARVSPGGTSLLFSTYLGGSGGSASYPESGQGIALDGQGNVYLAGMTSSPNFPMVHPMQAALNGWEDAFVAKLNSSGWPVYTTYLGGSGADYAGAIAVDSSGNTYVTGYTYSTDLPVVNALQPSIAAAGDADAFLGILNASGSALTYLSYLGGTAVDTGAAVAVDPNGGTYVAGWTLSSNFPLLHSLQPTNKGNYGAYVMKMQQLALRIACTHTGNFTQSLNGTYTVTVSDTATVPTNGLVTVTDTVSSGLTLISMTGPGWSCTGATCTRSDVLAGGGSYPPITVTVKVIAGAASPQQNTVNVTGGGDLTTRSATDTTTVVAGVTYTLSGRVTSSSGLGIAGLAVALSGSTSSTATTDSSGNYVFFGVPAGGNYTVSSANANCLFAPLSQSYANLNASRVVNFVATQNLAQGKTATESTTYVTSTASLAVDGNTDGVYSDGSLSIAGYATNAWWQVDLGASALVSSIVVWGRTDAWSSWLSDYWVFVSDTPFGASDTPSTLQTRAGTWSNHQSTAPSPSSSIVAGGARGRYVRVQLNGANYLEMAEVQVFGTTAPAYTISGQVTASGTGAGLAGITVSLAGNQTASATTDISGNYVFSGVGAGGPYTVTPSGGAYVFNPASQTIANVTANQTVTFVATSNLAQAKAATQSSTYATYAASLAVDGNTDGNGSHGSVSITNYSANAWWQVDLGASTAISSIIIWARTDGGWSSCLSDYWIFVSDTPFNSTDTPATLQNRVGTWASHQTTVPNPATSILGSGAQGRYVRVQLSGANYLEIAEVQVFGAVSAAYTVSGQVTLSGSGAPLANATISLTGNQILSTPTNSSGGYTFTDVLAGGNYTLTPSSTGYVFAPLTQSVSNLGQNQFISFVATSNLAQGKTATQSSTYSTYVANFAVDGKTSGNPAQGSLAITNYAPNAWWQVDLGASALVSSVIVWNRTDSWASCLSDYWVFISDTPFNATDTPATLQNRAGTWNNHQTTVPSPSTSIAAGNAQGRYVRVQLSGANYLELAEVQVGGAWK